MVKVKNKKNFGLADKLHVKKANAKQKRNLNPFEVHINKEKFKVLGKRSKCDRGLPGVSRAKAIQKRKNTIGHELKLVNKTNTFLDKRIGEKNVALSEEDKIMARFAAERIQQHKSKSGKQSIYNLAEEEILTHQGQTLEEIERFDDPRSDDEDDEELTTKKFGHLREGFVADANFGGGVLSRNENRDGALSRKDLIEQLIVESKKRKLEKQKLKEETLDLTQKLDTEWKDLQPVVSKNFNKEVEKTKEGSSLIDKLLNAYDKKNEDYDKTMRELKFEPRGTPSDRLKSEDEIAKQDKDKLEKLEQDRLARMHGTADMNKKTQPKHRSADDLEDNYEIDSDPEVMVAYDSEGKALMPERFAKKNDDSSDDESDENSGNDDKSENGADDGDENNSEVENNDNADGGNDSSDESEDSLNDLREPDVESSDNEDNEIEPKQVKNTKEEVSNKKRKLIEKTIETPIVVKAKVAKLTVKNESSKEETKNEIDNSAVNKIKADLLARKAMMEKAAAELPFTYDMPEDYDALQELLENQPPEYQYIIVERIIKCNHPKLGEANKEKLANLFAYLLQYLNDLFTDENTSTEEKLINSFRCFDRLSSHFFDIAQMDPNNAKNCVREVIKEKFDDYKNKVKVYPGLDTLIFFKLVSLIFPTSDLKHPIVTPCFIFMSHILTMARIKNTRDVAKGLFIVTLILEYTVLSKRILPSAINFIRGVLFLSVPTTMMHQIEVLQPFKAHGQLSNMLVLNKKIKKALDKTSMLAKYLITDDCDDEFKIRLLVTTVKIFGEFFKQADDLAIQQALFEHHIDLLDKIPLGNYPSDVVSLIEATKSSIEGQLKRKILEPLVDENKKPKTLRLYEPAVEKQFNGKKRRVMSKEKAEHEKLVYKHKKEMKGALREIRRDKTFIGSVKIQEKIKSDKIRKDKVKQIYSEASMQQGELNALQRSKKKKK